MQRVSIYFDGMNFLYGLKGINKRYKEFHFDFERFVKSCTQGKLLVSVYYYTASLKQNFHPELFKEQMKMLARLRNIGFIVRVCKRQPRKNRDGEEYFTVKGDDIWLALDMLRDAYEDKYEAILISGDSDFTPLVKYIHMRGKKVQNFHFKKQISFGLLSECDISKPITKEIVNKFFFRSKKKGSSLGN